MRILAVDTCGKSCSVAVSDGAELAAEVFTLRRQTHSRHLMPMVEMALEISGIRPEEIDAFAVTRGPGSFTGLRIGMSTVKGMALAVGKPVVGVSSLEALAWSVAVPGRLVCAVLDAGKGEVYGACYRFPERFSGQETEVSTENPPFQLVMEERVLRPGDLLEKLSEPCTFAGDGVRVYAGMIAERLGNLARFPADECHDIRASSVARLAILQLNRVGGMGPEALLPKYLRKSDAELSLGRPRTPMVLIDNTP